jgi:hypothetical protein
VATREAQARDLSMRADLPLTDRLRQISLLADDEDASTGYGDTVRAYLEVAEMQASAGSQGTPGDTPPGPNGTILPGPAGPPGSTR